MIELPDPLPLCLLCHLSLWMGLVKSNLEFFSPEDVEELKKEYREAVDLARQHGELHLYTERKQEPELSVLKRLSRSCVCPPNY